jgi:hypothetical protein
MLNRDLGQPCITGTSVLTVVSHIFVTRLADIALHQTAGTQQRNLSAYTINLLSLFSKVAGFLVRKKPWQSVLPFE